MVPKKNAYTFDFSHHRSLECLSFSLLSSSAGCRWLFVALSTIKPANSPRLSVITPYPRHVPPARIASETALGTTTKNLHDIGTEVKRIEDEWRKGQV